MVRLSFNVGILLILLGISSYYAFEAASMTALIPSLFGLAFCLLGIVAKKSESLSKHAMHAALLLALLGAAGSFSGFRAILTYLFGGPEPMRIEAALSHSVMAGLGLLFLILGLKSLIARRRSEERAEPGSARHVKIAPARRSRITL